MNEIAPFFVAIEGPIGVGKTTLARLLQPRFKAELLLEAFEENPFLSDFYADRAGYAFQTQMFFLLSRYRQQQSIPALLTQAPLIADYTFGKDSLFAHLNLEGDELDMYQRLYSLLSERVVIPNLVVYLRAEIDPLMVRIATRDRPYEREMDRAYIDSVREAYERYFASYTRTPLLSIDTDDLNYVDDRSALAFVEGQVRRALGIGAYQQPLPQMEPVRPVTAPVSPADVTQPGPRPRALQQFLAANEAMGRVAVALADTAGGATAPGTGMAAALNDVMGQLRRLADTLDVNLRTQGESG